MDHLLHPQCYQKLLSYCLSLIAGNRWSRPSRATSCLMADSIIVPRKSYEVRCAQGTFAVHGEHEPQSDTPLGLGGYLSRFWCSAASSRLQGLSASFLSGQLPMKEVVQAEEHSHKADWFSQILCSSWHDMTTIARQVLYLVQHDRLLRSFGYTQGCSRRLGIRAICKAGLLVC